LSETILIICSECGIAFDPDKRPNREEKGSLGRPLKEYKCPCCKKWVGENKTYFHTEDHDW
jgi:hypothetical protein